MSEIMHGISVWAIPVILAITLHEAAHGLVAWRLGDDTAYLRGRVTFNPLKHVDPFGTILLPALLLYFSGGRFIFGFAKPVPVNFSRLRKPRRDMVLVALAGPGTNLALALASALLLHLTSWAPAAANVWLADNLVNSVLINVLLAVFNMLPLPPLDGGRVAVGLLPDALAVPLARLERYGIYIVVAFFFVLPALGRQFDLDLNLFTSIIWPPVLLLIEFISFITGHL